MKKREKEKEEQREEIKLISRDLQSDCHFYLLKSLFHMCFPCETQHQHKANINLNLS